MIENLPACFKAYDIRGKVPGELNVDLAENIGRAFGLVCKVKKVVLGHDIRLTSSEMVEALIRGLTSVGVDVLGLGLCGTEEIYYAAIDLEADGVDGGIMVTASHNPADYNGMKIVGRGAKPVTADSGLYDIGKMAASGDFPAYEGARGTFKEYSHREQYISHLLSYVDVSKLKPLKIVVNSGNGCSGATLDALDPLLPVEFVRLHHQPDGTFPNGVPNPLLHANREETKNLVLESEADMGLAWDGDFDRCFFWDEKGNFIESYYIVGLLAQELLRENSGEKILYDPRLIWNTEELVKEAGGIPIMTATGHALIKERMRKEDALYGGEMSAHHYFRDFGYCDSGMIPWLLMLSIVSRSGKTLSELLGGRMKRFPVSGEINNRVADADAVIEKLEQVYGDGEKSYIDGLSVEYSEFRFNVRKSNTEPLLRLNVESRGDEGLMSSKLEEILTYIK